MPGNLPSQHGIGECCEEFRFGVGDGAGDGEAAVRRAAAAEAGGGVETCRRTIWHRDRALSKNLTAGAAIEDFAKRGLEVGMGKANKPPGGVAEVTAFEDEMLDHGGLFAGGLT